MPIHDRWPGVALAAVLMAALPAAAHDAGDFLIRARGIAVVPDESGSTDLLRGNIEVGNTGAPELDFSYFFTRHVAVELIAAVTRHKLDLENSALGNIELGRTWVLPPTVTMQFHPFPKSTFSPYIGAGVNYTFFFGESDGAVNDVDVKNAAGFALQVGADWQFPDSRWFLNVDVKRLFLRPDVVVKAGAATIRDAGFELDPWVMGIGVGYRF